MGNIIPSNTPFARITINCACFKSKIDETASGKPKDEGTVGETILQQKTTS